MNYPSFVPPVRTLMGPGPSDMDPRVLAAMSRPIIGHLDPSFIGMMEQTRVLLQYAFQTSNELTLPISGPGSAGMETCFVNLVEPGDKVVVCINGVFGMRMKENVERCGGIPVVIEFEWGHPVDPYALERTLSAHPDARVVAFVHAETSTGVCSDVKTLTRIAHERNCLVIVDTVTGLGGIEFRMDDWGVDAVYSGTQKCLSCTPGLSPVSFGPRAIERIRARRRPVQSWFMDLNLLMGYWGSGSGKRAYHHTAPINTLYALHESLVILREEGLEAAWARHHHHHQALKGGLEALGLQMLVDEAHRLPQLNSVRVPEGIDEAAVRTRLLKEYGLEIGAGLGSLAGKIWRIGLMGHGCNRRNVLLCLHALEAVLRDLGHEVDSGAAIRAARLVYGKE